MRRRLRDRRGAAAGGRRQVARRQDDGQRAGGRKTSRRRRSAGRSRPPARGRCRAPPRPRPRPRPGGCAASVSRSARTSAAIYVVGRASLGLQPGPHLRRLPSRRARPAPGARAARPASSAHASVMRASFPLASSAASRPRSRCRRLRTPDTDRPASRAVSSSVSPSQRCMTASVAVEAASGSSAPNSFPAGCAPTPAPRRRPRWPRSAQSSSSSATSGRRRAGAQPVQADVGRHPQQQAGRRLVAQAIAPRARRPRRRRAWRPPPELSLRSSARQRRRTIGPNRR